MAAGILAEAAFLGVSIPFARIGPCGPANVFGAALILVHLPGSEIANHLLPQNSFLELTVIVGVTAALWGAVAYFVISVARALSDKTD